MPKSNILEHGSSIIVQNIFPYSIRAASTRGISHSHLIVLRGIKGYGLY
jgi:hypothetical protein